MTTKTASVSTTDFAARDRGDRRSWSLSSSDPATASAALALALALLRALKDRGVLAPGELDDILAEARGRLVNDPSALWLLNAVRDDLERKDED
jgi:hypothetical protein